MKLNVTIAAMVACMAFATQGFGYDLLDRMLGKSGCGDCASGCATVAAGPACGCDNVAPSCGADAGCGKSWNKCRQKLVDFNVKCVKIPVVVPKIRLPKIKLPKITWGSCNTGCDSGCGAAPSCGADAGCGAAAMGPTCGADAACGSAPSCGCGSAAPTCGADAACGPMIKIKRPGLLDRIRCKMAAHRANMKARMSSCNSGCATPSCGADAGCGAAVGPTCGADAACGSAAPSCGCDGGYSAPAATHNHVVPPTPVVDPAA